MYTKDAHQHQRHRGSKGDHGANAGVPSKKKSSRSKMSCKQCRDRKVKCDRIYPCSPCVSRGRSADCLFENSGTAVDQAQAIKNHRKQEERLLRKINELEQFIRDNHSDTGIFPLTSLHSDPSSNPSKGARGRKTKNRANLNSPFSGKLSLACLTDEYEKLNHQPLPASLTHPTPRALDLYAYQNSTGHVFPCLWPTSTGVAPLLQCLPAPEETLRLFTLFEQRSQACPFPHAPDGISRDEIVQFLSKPASSAERRPSMLALIFVILANGDLIAHQNTALGKARYADKISQSPEMKGDVFVAAAMQALRLGGFMNRPNLSSVQALLLLSPYLVNTGRFLDASSLFGLTVRLAQSIGLHREPTRLKPVLLSRECLTRRTIWWYILYLDQYFSSTLGRPLSVSCFGDCLPPVPLKVDDVEHRLLRFICQFTVTTTEILRSEDLTNNEIDYYSEKLLRLLETLPHSVQFNETWLCLGTLVPSWPLDIQAVQFYIQTHVYLILMNRQQGKDFESEPPKPPNGCSSMDIESTPGYNQSLVDPVSSNPRPVKTRQSSQCRSQSLGYDQILSSSRAIIRAFEFLCGRNALNMLDWTICQAAFHAAYVLGMAMYERNDFQTDVRQILTTQLSFDELAKSISDPGDSPLRGILTLSRMASDKLAVFLKGSWNDLNSNEDVHGEPERVMDQKGMILLEDPGLIHPTSQHDYLGIINWEALHPEFWDNEHKKKPEVNMGTTLTFMHDEPVGDAIKNSDDLTIHTDPFPSSLRQQTSLPSGQWGASHLNERQESPSNENVPSLVTTSTVSMSPHNHYELVKPVPDDIDTLLSRAPLPQPLNLQNVASDTSFSPAVPNAQVNGVFVTDPCQRLPQPPMFYPKIHPPQALHSPTKHVPYNNYSPGWETFPSRGQREQSTPSSASFPQPTTSNQSQFSASPSIVGTPGNSFLPIDLGTTCQPQNMPATCDIEYSQADVLASSSVYRQHNHVAPGFNWSRQTLQ